MKCVVLTKCPITLFFFSNEFCLLLFLWKTMLLNLIIGEKYCILSYNFVTFLNAFAIDINKSSLVVASIYCGVGGCGGTKSIYDVHVLKLAMTLKIMLLSFIIGKQCCGPSHIIQLSIWEKDQKEPSSGIKFLIFTFFL